MDQNTAADNNLNSQTPNQINPAVDVTPPAQINPQPEIKDVPLPSLSRKRHRLVALAIFLPLVLLLGSGSLAYAIAYNKINLGNSNLQDTISQTIQSLPFTPKTPKFVLEKSLAAHDSKKLTKYSLDLSLAANSNSFTNILNLPVTSLGTQIQGELKGNIDYANLKNPRFDLNLSLTKDFNVDTKKNDALLFFKVNKVPWQIIAPILGLADTSKLQNFLNTWVSYDTTPLNTEAQRILDQSNPQTPYTNEALQKAMNNFLDQRIEQQIILTEEQNSGFPVYHLQLKPNDALVDYIEQKIQAGVPSTNTGYKISSYVKKVEINLWINQKTYYVQEANLSFKYATPATESGLNSFLSSGPPSIEVALDIKLSNFNQPVNISVPSQSMTIEQYYNSLMASFNATPSTKDVTAQAQDSKRKSDIQVIKTALLLCYTESKDQKYVAKLDDLITCGGLKTIPLDPTINQPYEYQVNTTDNTFTLKAKLSDGQDYTVTPNSQN